jgi:hypothetical protein
MSKSTFDEQIEEAERAYEAARDTADAAKERLDALYVQRSTELFGIEVGMRVRDQKDREFIVEGVRPQSYGGKPWLYVRKITKDGKPSERLQSIYSDWQIVAAGVP